MKKKQQKVQKSEEKAGKERKIEKKAKKRRKKSTGFLITPLKRRGGFKNTGAASEIE